MKRLFGIGIVLVLAAACQKAEKSIRIKGSDTEVNLTVLLAEAFYRQHPEIFVSVSGGGSGLGIASLLNGTTDLANSSRSLSGEEQELFRSRHTEVDSFAFAQDAIAFVVASSLPVDSLSVAQLAPLLAGTTANWQALGGPDLPVNIYGRQSNSGTHAFIRKKLNIHFSPRAKEMNGNAQILEALRADGSGIGYVGAGYVVKGGLSGIKVLKIYTDTTAAFSPLDKEAIRRQQYFFQRPLFQFFRKSACEKILPFLRFEQSAAGQRIIEASGYYPTSVAS